MSLPPKLFIYVTLIFGLLPEPSSAQQALDRREANQPILLVDSEAPASNIIALRFVEDSTQGLRLLAAGEGKVVWQWQVRTDPRSKTVSLEPLSRIRWPINRGLRGMIFSMASGRPLADAPPIVAFGGFGALPTLVQLQTVGLEHPLSALHSPELPFPQNGVYCLEFWPEPAKLLAVGCTGVEAQQALVLIWDLERPARPREILETGFDAVRFLRVSPNGRTLVAADGSGLKLRRWNIGEKDSVRPAATGDFTLPSQVVGLEWEDDQRCLVATMSHGLVPLGEKVDPATARLVLRNRTTRPLTFAARANGENMTSWDVAAERSRVVTTPLVQQIAIREGNSDWQTTDLDLRVSSSWELDAELDAKGRPKIFAFAGMSLFASSNGVSVALKSGLSLDRTEPNTFKIQKRIGVDNLRSDRSLRALLQEPSFSGAVTALAVSPDGQFVAAAGEHPRATAGRFGEQPIQEIRVWRVSDGSLVAVAPDRLAVPTSLSPIHSVGLSRSQSKATVPDVVLFSWGNDVQVKLSIAESLNDQAVSVRPVNANGAAITGTAQAWSVRPDKDRFWLTRQKPQPQEVGPFPQLTWLSSDVWEAHRFSRQKKEYMAIGDRGGILIWDLERLQQLAKGPTQQQERALVRCFYGHTGRLRCLSVSEDRNYLISGATDGSICLWSLNGIERAYDGVRELGLKLQHDANRTRVEEVTKGLPAFFAGLEPNDELVQIRPLRPGRSSADWIVLPEQFEPAIKEIPPGLGVQFQVRGRPAVMTAELIHEPLWTLYPMLDGQWVMVTPSQVFGASSDEAMRRFGWHLNLGSDRENQVALFPLDLFRESHENIVPIVQTSWKDQRPLVRSSSFHIPTLVEITEVRAADSQRATIANELSQAVDLDVSLSLQRSGQETPKQLQLWCNGRFVQQAELDSKTSAPSLFRWSVPKSLLRVGDRNMLIAVVRSESGSPPIKLVNRAIRTISVAGTSTPKMHFLGVGVTDLDQAARFQQSLSPIKPLRFAANDVCLLGLALAERAQASGFELGEFRYLVAKTPEGIGINATQVAPPTHDEVLKALDHLQATAAPNDFLCVSISCHGFVADNGAYLVVQDSAPDFHNTVTDRELFEDRLWKLNCPALVFLDACHSGSALTGDSLRGMNGFGLGPEILVSCKPQQESYERDRLHQFGKRWFGMSVFTASLLEALTGHELSETGVTERQMTSVAASSNIDRNGDGFLSVEELGLHATLRVPVLQKMTRPESSDAENVQQPDLLPSLSFPRSRIRLRAPVIR